MSEGIRIRTNLPQFKGEMDLYKKQFVSLVVSADRAAAGVFAKALRREAPKDTGRLRAAVIVKRARRVARGTVHFIVGIRQGKSQQRIKRKRKGQATEVNLDAYYWRFLEQGWIPRAPGRRLRGGARKKALEREQNKGKKISYPFILPAFRKAGSQALQVFYDRLNRGTP